MLNLGLVVGLVAVGITAHSLAVLAEGSDYLLDAAGVGVALLAIRLSARPASRARRNGSPTARIGLERLRQILHGRGIPGPGKSPCHGSSWARRKRPARLPATYHRTHGVRYFHRCYSLGDDQLRGVTRHRKGADYTLAAFKSIRAAGPGGYRLFIILDNLPANKTPAIRRWAERVTVELCFTPTNASWANPRRSSYLCHGRLALQPNRAGPAAAGLPALAQRQRPPPRRPGRPAPGRAAVRSERRQRWGHSKPKAA